MGEHFCTYFDHRYVAKGLAMWKSLKTAEPTATLHVLCLNQACHEIVASIEVSDLHLYSLADVERAEPRLSAARANRSLIEYYFTLTPHLPLHIFNANPEITRLTYLDADLFFFSSPAPLFDEIGDDAVGLVEHRFPATVSSGEKFGRFNVGWLTFLNDPIARDCLNRWREQCLEWCHDRSEPGRFAEQKYLDDWPEHFPRIHIITHPGANLAPWNLNRFTISWQDAAVRVNDQPLIFFHAHGFQPRSPGRPRMLNLEQYGVEETALLSRAIFDPYERALIDSTVEIAVPLAMALLADQPREVVSLREALAASEADREARLQFIHGLQEELARYSKTVEQLTASISQHAAQLDHVQEQLASSERDGMAKAHVIHDQQTRLDNASDALRQLRDHSEAALDESRRYVARVLNRLTEVERSRSWRWTSPVRWLAAWGRKG